MASGTKKRRKSQSPIRGSASKRARVASKRTQHDEPDPHSSRAGSVRNTYQAQKQIRSTSLPTGDDWVFRVKVISSATDLGNDLFKNAVQGLVRICFPEGILDQLGSQVLEQHMREEKAPEDNIKRMKEVFRSEMEQRMVSMIAEHLDTAAKVDSVLRRILSASARAHGDNLGKNILGYITAGLLNLNAKVSGQSTQWLAGGGAAATEGEKEESSDGDSSTSNISDEEPTPPPPKVNISKKRERKSRRARSKTPDDITEEVEVDADLPATLPEQRTSKDKSRKISLKWYRDVNSKELSNTAIARIFSRTTDLFAYHALPISKQKLGPNASRSQITRDIQSALDATPAEEFEEWAECLQKLLNGDRNMLERQEMCTSGDQLQSARATPAPIYDRTRSRAAAKDLSGGMVFPSTHPGNVGGPSYKNTLVKREDLGSPSAHPDTSSKSYPNDSASEATTALRSLPIEHSHSRSLVSACPITLLLWGKDSINPSQYISMTETIMANLNRRVSAEYVRRVGRDDTEEVMTKTQLKDAIISAFPRPGKSLSETASLQIIERNLVPWIVLEPSAFPELANMPFVFINMMTDIPVTQNLLFGSWPAASAKDELQTWYRLLVALEQRGISEESAATCFIDQAHISTFCKKKNPDAYKRIILERMLRRLAFYNRDKFPELKATAVVKTWEEKTGLTW
ncbi:hypothetical protein J4E85_010963 [Alternaria conjuncta]|uniref:uncharacterized protein n=1 Tax=Alternaria conjuncta TaxID=181017 RepID=UPI00221EE1EF|nr:uncharacterized protein J4E85_010963 [Alternaria conjuncta]KAI4912988.1 hypothetical protein J4E85_010963 [Alternaria conjuncta]